MFFGFLYIFLWPHFNYSSLRLSENFISLRTVTACSSHWSTVPFSSSMLTRSCLCMILRLFHHLSYLKSSPPSEQTLRIDRIAPLGEHIFLTSIYYSYSLFIISMWVLKSLHWKMLCMLTFRVAGKTSAIRNFYLSAAICVLRKHR